MRWLSRVPSALNRDVKETRRSERWSCATASRRNDMAMSMLGSVSVVSPFAASHRSARLFKGHVTGNMTPGWSVDRHDWQRNVSLAVKRYRPHPDNVETTGNGFLRTSQLLGTDLKPATATQMLTRVELQTPFHLFTVSSKAKLKRDAVRRCQPCQKQAIEEGGAEC